MSPPFDFDRDDGNRAEAGAPAGRTSTAPGKRTRTQGLTSRAPLPHLAQVQEAFGPHDVSGVEASTGLEADALVEDAADDVDAEIDEDIEAFAFGERVGFREPPTLHTVAHEAAHVVQQRHAGARLQGLGAAGDEHERHADEVADRVVAGHSAVELLDRYGVLGGGRANALQLKRGVKRKADGDKDDTPSAKKKKKDAKDSKESKETVCDGFAIQVCSEDRVHISAVLVAGRPAAPRVGADTKDGDHTTPWAVMRLAVNNRLVGKTLREAIAEMATLFEEADSLPGAEPDRIKAQKAQFRERHDAMVRAKKDAEGARDFAIVNAHNVNCDPNHLQSSLQVQIGTYLAYRNLLPLSVMDLGLATGDGEPGRLRELQYWEEKAAEGKAPNKSQQQSLTRAIGGLGSPDVAAYLKTASLTDVRQRLPGATPTDTRQSVTDALQQQHAATTAGAFPHVDDLMDFETTSFVFGDKSKNSPPKESKHVSTGAPLAVQGVTDAKGKITDVRTGGRPAHVPHGTQYGDHSSCNALAVLAAQRAMRGSTPLQAEQKLENLGEQFLAMPGATDDRVSSMEDRRQTHFENAQSEFDASLQASNGSLASVQSLASSLLTLREALPLTTVASGSVSTGNGEPKALAALRKVEAKLQAGQQASRTDALQALTGTYDARIVSRLLDADAGEDDLPNGSISAPGVLAGESAEDTLTASAGQHVESVSQAAPNLAAILRQPSMMNAFVGTLVDAHDVDTSAIATNLLSLPSLAQAGKGSVTAAPKNADAKKRQTFKAKRPGKGGRKKPSEDDDWSPNS